MKKFAVVDCETDPFEHGAEILPFVWGFYDGKIYKKFTQTKELVEFIKQFDGYIFAHNGGKFDWHFVLEFLPQDEYTDILMIHGRMAEFKLGKATLRDSYNILTVPLAKLGKTDFDYSKLKRDVREDHMVEILDYLCDDCVFLWDYLKRWFEEYPHALTLAGTAMKVWKKMGGYIPNTSIGYFKDMQKFYYGGRCEHFVTGHVSGNFELFDISSAYPAAMMLDHPVAIKNESPFILTTSPKDEDYNHAFFVVDAYSEGALPLKEKHGLKFPHGRFVFCCTGIELQTGLDLGAVKIFKIIECRVPKNTMHFSEYITRFYSEKARCEREGDKVGREFAKLLMNSLYGKYGANPEAYSQSKLGRYGSHEPDGYKFNGTLGNLALFERPLPEEKYRFYDIGVAASITGHVRAKLFKTIKQSKNVLYCDTDSILCEKFSGTVSSKLGEWKKEGDVYDVYIAGKKMYLYEGDFGYDKEGKKIDHKKASKGVKLTKAEIKKIALGTTVEYLKPEPTFSKNAGSGYYYISREINRG